MAVFKIESTRVKGQLKFTRKCTFVSTSHHEIRIGSSACKSCKWINSNTKTEVDCGFKRTW